MKMSVKNVVLLILVVLGALSVLRMLGIRTPRVEFMENEHGDDHHDKKKHNDTHM